MNQFNEVLKRRLDEACIPYGSEVIDRCRAYYTLVTQANRQFNLTRITDEAQAADMHFADAMALARMLDIAPQSRVVDIGTGAGFPGVPLKLLRPDLRLTLLDSSGKKTDFIKQAAASLGLDVTVLCARAEQAANTALRESFDIALSRAVAPLPVLLELCVPFVKPSGVFAAWKGESFEEELAAAKTALFTLGCRAAGRHSIGRGAVLLIEKQKPTQPQYPRRFTKIKNSPL